MFFFYIKMTTLVIFSIFRGERESPGRWPARDFPKSDVNDNGINTPDWHDM